MAATKGALATILSANVGAYIKTAIEGMDAPVKNACAAAVVVAGTRTIALGQANMRAHLHGVVLARSWTARYYPGGGKREPTPHSIDSAVFAYSRVPFLEIFEDGGTIQGKPFLWIALRNAPTTVGHGITRGHVSPGKLRAEGIKLFSITRAGKPPLLATKVNLPRSQAGKVNLSVTLAKLKKHGASARLAPMTVPLFFGIQKVTIKKALDLAGIASRERDALPEYYVANLQAD